MIDICFDLDPLSFLPIFTGEGPQGAKFGLILAFNVR